MMFVIGRDKAVLRQEVGTPDNKTLDRSPFGQ